jgi:hypothetical protein
MSGGIRRDLIAKDHELAVQEGGLNREVYASVPLSNCHDLSDSELAKNQQSTLKTFAYITKRDSNTGDSQLCE